MPFVDTVASTIDATRNVAAAAVDKGSNLIGSAKGIRYYCNQSTSRIESSYLRPISSEFVKLMI